MTNFRLSSLLVCATTLLAGASAFAQTSFTPGNLVVSRSVYQGTAATIAVGQPLPPVCPSTAVCTGSGNGGPATDSGAYPSTTSTNNVWNNDNVDGSFGVTSPIFLDQITPTGALVNTLAIPTTMVNTSFSSKSELALNRSADGTAITFMAYLAPPNTVDVSDANSPGAYDPTNPAGGSYYRSVVQVGANGAIQVTPTNSFSGTPANIIETAGVQMAIPGQSAGTPAIQVGNFSLSQLVNPATGLPYPPDKAGKDNNFRGLTIFNNTLYVSKGSGSNGIDTVYRVGDEGSLPTEANAASAALTVLPGFSTTPEKSGGVGNPFGLFFANSTTLYVADEGDGTTADAATSKVAGLQKWILTNGTWKMAYLLQSGLNLGQQYTVANYPTSLNPATDGLRNIAGKINGDGTVTIYAITSTVSANGDTGADPNMLVSITDTIANTTAPTSESFTTIMSAPAGQVLRGVCLAPTASSTAPAMTNVPLVISAANVSAAAIAPGSLATANGQSLTSVTGTPGTPFPTSHQGTSASIVDSTGVMTAAPLLYVSPTQITFLVPAGVALGTAQVVVTSSGGTQTANNIEITIAAPGLLTLNGNGLAAADVVQVSSTGAQTVQQVYTTNSDGAVIANPIAVGSGNTTYLLLYGTGIAGAGTALTTVTIDGVSAKVAYAGPAGADTGLDQVDVIVPASLSGAGNVNVQLTAAGITANSVQITIQ